MEDMHAPEEAPKPKEEPQEQEKTHDQRLRRGKWTVSRLARVQSCLLELWLMDEWFSLGLLGRMRGCAVWQAEEEEYTSKIIRYFNRGLLRLPEGTTLRSYLAEQLMCDPMRITKKYSGPHCLGKRVFHPCEQKAATAAEMDAAAKELEVLHKRFLHRLRNGSPREESRLRPVLPDENLVEDTPPKETSKPVPSSKELAAQQHQARVALLQALSARVAAQKQRMVEVPTTTQVTYTPYPLPGYSYTYTQAPSIVYSPPPPPPPPAPVYSYVVAVPSAHIPPPPPPPPATQYIYHAPPHIHAPTAGVTAVPVVPHGPGAVVKHARVLEVPGTTAIKRPRTVYAPAGTTLWDPVAEASAVRVAAPAAAAPTRVVYTYDPSVQR